MMEWQYFSYVVLMFVLFSCIFLLWSRRKLYILSYNLPGPTAFPLIGNALSCICKPQDYLNRILQLTESYASPVRVWLGPHLVIYVKDPDQFQVLMHSPKMTKKAYVYSFFEPIMGKGLFTSSGFQHKSQRKLLQPLFGSKVVEGYSLLFQKHAIKFAERLNVYVNKGDFDVLTLLHNSAFEATMDMLLEGKTDQTKEHKHIPECVRKFYHIYSQRVISLWTYLDSIYKLTSQYREQQMILKVIDTLTKEIKEVRIPQIQKKLDCKPSDVCTENNTDLSRAPSMLEMMLQIMRDNPNCLNEKEFMDHVLTFVFTSQDTQSSALGFTLMMLGMHPDIQDKAFEEIKDVLGNKTCADFNDVGKLKYLEMCLKETMRLFPVGPVLAREVTEDTEFESFIFPVGCTVVFSIYQLHRNPKFWEKPEEFYPEHFTADAVAKRHPYAFLPFSAGPRRCIAPQFSYINMTILMSAILQKYAIECEGTLKNLKLQLDVSIKPIDGYMIRLKNRVAESTVSC